MPGPVLLTPVIDDFNRANQDPIGVPWIPEIQEGTGVAAIISSTMGTNAGGGGTAYYQLPCPQNQEAWATITTLPANDDGGISIYARLNQAQTPGIDAYRVIFRIASGVKEMLIFRQDNGSSNFLNSASPVTFNAGDAFAISAVGSDITGWTKASGGSWTQIVTASDTTYPTSGFLAVGFSFTTRIDDFGGGPLIFPQIPRQTPRPVFRGRGA